MDYKYIVVHIIVAFTLYSYVDISMITLVMLVLMKSQIECAYGLV